VADLGRLWKWAVWTPDLGDNLQQERPFFLRVKTGLTKIDFAGYTAALDAYWKAERTSDALHALVSPFVEMGDEPLRVDGNPVDGLRGYVELLFSLGSAELREELTYSVIHFNSAGGTQALFYGRLSGGSAFTAEPNAGRAALPKASR
jgi:hypothetical protein